MRHVQNPPIALVRNSEEIVKAGDYGMYMPGAW